MAAEKLRAQRIVIVGGGKMGEAILSGWIKAQEGAAAHVAPNHIVVIEPGLDRRRYLSDTYGVTCAEDASAVSENDALDLVVLSVKPQVMMDVLASISKHAAFAATPGPLFVSIAAGLPIGKIASALPEGARLVRVMPNMPLMVGAGASGVCASASVGAEDVDYVANLFGCLGRAVVVDESDMDAVCALSGSGPAYVAAMIESLRDAAAARGLDAGVAETLALQTVLGTAQLIANTDLSPQQAREAVCSPGGTTLAALDAMNAAGFDRVFDAGVEAAIRRSKELAQCS